MFSFRHDSLVRRLEIYISPSTQFLWLVLTGQVTA